MNKNLSSLLLLRAAAACFALLIGAASAAVSNVYSDGEKLSVGIKLCHSNLGKGCKDVFFSENNYTYTGKKQETNIPLSLQTPFPSNR